MELLRDVLKQVTSPLSTDNLVDQTAALLTEQRDDELCNSLLEFLGFDILDNGILDELLAVEAKLLEALKEPVVAAPNTVSYSGTKMQQKYCTTPLLDMQFMDSLPSLTSSEELLPVTILPECLRAPFDFTYFNALQSSVFEFAYRRADNLLVSAPTSSGKTNVALLCIMQMIESLALQHGQSVDSLDSQQLHKLLSASNDLCVYLTPLKALASEITEKFKLELKQLGFSVLECTGDENPPEELVDNANLLILTPEKYDVITRKSVNESIFLRQKLLIIDEIHLLGTRGRGHVLESIVCRTKAAIEELQTPVRFVGISATIPNYNDVARFLECQEDGVFVFGDEYRPVPMTEFLIGVKNARFNDATPIPHEVNIEVNSYRNINTHLNEVMEALDSVHTDYVQMAEETVEKQRRKEDIDKENIRKSRKDDSRPKSLPKNIDVEELYDDLCTKIAIVNNENEQSTMIFVHSRRKSVELAKVIANQMPVCDFDENIIKSAKGCEKGDLAFCMSRGVAFHNAQIDKQFKKLVEDQYRKGEIVVVVCTATLAWGVNLPAQTVVIRGTNVFSDGLTRDLDILDVKQIFGRAGRPQFMQTGELGRGIILTTYDKLPEYVRWLRNETLIESHVGDRLTDILNAEIVLGNISTVGQAIGYMRWSFYAIRQINYIDMILNALSHLQQNHLIFASEKIVQDENLLLIPTELGKICSYYYIPFDSLTNFILAVSECPISSGLSHDELLDIICQTPEFEQFTPRQDEQQELTQMSGEGLDAANDEIMEKLETRGISSKKMNLMLATSLKQESIAALSTQCGRDESGYKVNILLQAFVKRYEPKTASLIADQRIITKSAPRVAQAFMEVLVSMKRANEMLKMNDIATSFAYERWYFEASPLLPIVVQPVGETTYERSSFQVSYNATMRRGGQKYISLEMIEMFHKHFPLKDLFSYERLESLSFDDIRDVMGKDAALQITTCIKYIPQLYIDAFATPISSMVLRINVYGTPIFKFVKEIHGYGVDFCILVARQDNGHILNAETVTVGDDSMHTPINIVTLVKIDKWQSAELDSQVLKNTKYLQSLQDDEQNEDFPELKVICFPKLWCGSKSVVQERVIETSSIYLQEGENICYPVFHGEKVAFRSKIRSYTPLPKVRPLSTKALHWEEAEGVFTFTHFNPLQSVMFNTLYYGGGNVFVGAPTSSGKTVAAELAVLQLLRDAPNKKAIYIAPIKALVRERSLDWSNKFKVVGATVIEITGDLIPRASELAAASIIITTPEKWDAMSRQWREKQFLQSVGLIVLDEVHLIGTSRGAILESIVARYLMIIKALQYNIRFVALSTPSINVREIASWLKVPYHNIFNFDNEARPVKLDLHIEGYIGERYCARMDLMNRPVYAAIKKYASSLPVLVFVQSRKQTRKTALSLINFAINDPEAPECFLKFPNDDLAAGIQDKDAQHCIKFGVGIHHSGMSASDRSVIEQLYLKMHITILVCTATLAAGVNIPAYMTILKGCEYFDGRLGQYVDFDIVDVQQMAGRAGRPQYIQYRLKQQIREFFGEGALDHIERNGFFDRIYYFDKDYVRACLPPGIADPEPILAHLEQLNAQTPQALSIIMCRQSAKEFYKSFFEHPFPFESSLLNETLGNPLAVVLDRVTDRVPSRFPDFVCAEISTGGTEYMQLRVWLEMTFFFLRARRNPELYGIDMNAVLEEMKTTDLGAYQREFQMYAPNDAIERHRRAELNDFFTCLHIYRLLDSCLDMLVELRLIERRGAGIQAFYARTALGECQSVYYLSHRTVALIAGASPQNTQQLIELLARAEEFATLPVRCPETAEMLEFGAKHGIPPPAQELVGTSHHKAYFALYARHLGITDFPSPEYALDSRTCFASAPRLMAALVHIKAIQRDNECALLAVSVGQRLNRATVEGKVRARARLVEEKTGLMIEFEVFYSGYPDVLKSEERVSPLSVCAFCEGQFTRTNGGSGRMSIRIPVQGRRTLAVYCCSEGAAMTFCLKFEEAELTREWADSKVLSTCAIEL